MKEILDIIHKTIYQFFDVCEDDEEVPISNKDKLLLEVNKAICNNLKALEQEPSWIPISERLPEEAGVYLVSMNRLGYPQREVDGFVCGRWERFGNDVIAWCKIPEPYKEESEGEI